MSAVRTYRDRVIDQIATALHDCPGLQYCEDHPRWTVTILRTPLTTRFYVCEPGPDMRARFWVFPTHAAAFAHAWKEATR